VYDGEDIYIWYNIPIYLIITKKKRKIGIERAFLEI